MEHEKLVSKIKEIKGDDSFLITITRLDEKSRNLDTFLFVNNFPLEDLAGTKDEIARLIGEYLKDLKK